MVDPSLIGPAKPHEGCAQHEGNDHRCDERSGWHGAHSTSQGHARTLRAIAHRIGDRNAARLSWRPLHERGVLKPRTGLSGRLGRPIVLLQVD